MDRRNFLIGAAVVAGAGLLPAAARAAASKLFVQAQTTAGIVRGIEVDGIRQFRGVPYGAPTSGANRFMPPRPRAPWRGIRDAYGYGEITPQPFSTPAHPFGNLIDFDLHVGAMGEDCLNLNIWTPGLRDGARRPVLVYFHGGGLSTGSGNHDLYVGDRLARFGDVVVVTVNHRLSAFGYLNLEDAGAPAEFADAGNAGILDLVQSLAWVRDNIAEFGGDPRRVTIFGQSGGGTKVGAVMAIAGARGLYHRAAIQSGSLAVTDREQSAAAARALLGALGIGRGEWAKLQSLPAETLVDAQIAIGTYDWIGFKSGKGQSPQFVPVVDGRRLRAPLLDAGSLATSADVPLIVGYCRADYGWTEGNFDLDDQGLLKVAGQLAGPARAREAVDRYARAYPDDSPFVIQGSMLTDKGLLPKVAAIAEARERAGGKTYVYRFDWPSKAFGGRFGPTHGMDMSLVFHNTHQPTLGGDTPEARAMADKMAGAWVAFAAAGAPATNRLPAWAPYTAARRETMVINSPMQRLVSDPNGELRRFWQPGA